MRHRTLLLIAAVTGLLACACGGTEAERLHRAAMREYLDPIRPGYEGRNPFWNAFATKFIYAPAFGFEPGGKRREIPFHRLAPRNLDGRVAPLPQGRPDRRPRTPAGPRAGRSDGTFVEFRGGLPAAEPRPGVERHSGRPGCGSRRRGWTPRDGSWERPGSGNSCGTSPSGRPTTAT